MIALAPGILITVVSIAMISGWVYLFRLDISSGEACGVGISYAVIYVLIYSLFLISGLFIVLKKRLTKTRAIIVITTLAALIGLRIFYAFPIRTLLNIPVLEIAVDPNLTSQILILICFLIYVAQRKGRPI